MTTRASYQGWLDAQDALPEDARHIPDDAVCSECDRLIWNHPGTEKVLAIRKLKYYDPERRKTVLKAPIPYCICNPRTEYQS